MSAPLYFLPSLSAAQLAPAGQLGPLDASILAARGLAGVLADVGPGDFSCFDLRDGGPGSTGGALLCALPVSQQLPVRLGFFPDAQEWTEFGGYWIGVDRDAWPTPEDLQRKVTYRGPSVTMPGGDWEIPVIRSPEGESHLPQVYCPQADGAVAMKIRRDWQALFDRFARACWLFFDPTGPESLQLGPAETLDLCLAAIGVNYRVGRGEQAALGLVDSLNAVRILAAAVDLGTYYDVYRAAQEKKRGLRASATPASAATPPGPADDCPDTGPATASSPCLAKE